MDPSDLTLRYGWHLGTLAYSCLSGLVPVLNCELLLVWLAVKAPRSDLVGLILTATAGQMVAKVILYASGRGILRLRARGGAARLADLAARFDRPWKAAGVVFLSAATGFPPLYALSVAAGALRWSLPAFVICATAGRVLRFSAVLLLPPGLGGTWLPGLAAIAVALTTGAGLLAGASLWSRQRLDRLCRRMPRVSPASFRERLRGLAAPLAHRETPHGALQETFVPDGVPASR